MEQILLYKQSCMLCLLKTFLKEIFENKCVSINYKKIYKNEIILLNTVEAVYLESHKKRNRDELLNTVN